MKTLFISIFALFIFSNNINANNVDYIPNKDTIVIIIDYNSDCYNLSFIEKKENLFVNVFVCDRYNKNKLTVVDLVGTGNVLNISEEKFKTYKQILSKNIINASSLKKLKTILKLNNSKDNFYYVVYTSRFQRNEDKRHFYKKNDKTVTIYESILNYKNIKYK